MKKLALVLCSLIAITSVAQAKEMVSEPVMTSSKEVVAEPAIVEEIVPVVVAPAIPLGYVNLRAGWDFWSEYDTHRVDGDRRLIKDTDESGYEVAVEMMKNWKYFDVGLGLAYQDHAKRDSHMGVSGGEYKSVPIYLTAKYDINYWDSPFVPYLKVNAGYSFNFDENDIKADGISYGTEIDDGAYWAAGIGFEYNNFTADFLYGINYAEMKVDAPAGKKKFDNDYQRVTFSVGYNFNIW